MATKLITEKVWFELTSAVKKSRTKSLVAVAYFAKGAANMLPVKKGSILVVDASEKAVKCGQTCPAELIKLYTKGVRIFSYENLHAKLFIVNNALYIGSTNVSGSSSQRLKEVLLKSTDKKTIADAKNFIESLCSVELGTELLSNLDKIYRPPKIVGVMGARSAKPNPEQINGSDFHITKLKLTDWDDYETEQADIGEKEAKKKRINRSFHQVESFIWTGKPAAKVGDIVMQVLKAGNVEYVFPPGIVIHTRKLRSKGKPNTIFYVEVPIKKRKKLETICRVLSPVESKLIKRNGKRSNQFAETMFAFWNK